MKNLLIGILLGGCAVYYMTEKDVDVVPVNSAYENAVDVFKKECLAQGMEITELNDSNVRCASYE